MLLNSTLVNELGYKYNSVNDKIESNAPQDALEGTEKNLLAGEQVGGQMTKSLVAMGEQALLNKYNSNKQ